MEKKTSQPIPAWGWVFAAACGIIPVLTLLFLEVAGGMARLLRGR